MNTESQPPVAEPAIPATYPQAPAGRPAVTHQRRRHRHHRKYLGKRPLSHVARSALLFLMALAVILMIVALAL